MFRNAKVGDWAFTIQLGWIKIAKIYDELDCEFGIYMQNGVAFTYDGMRDEHDLFPSAWPEGHPGIPHWAPERPRVMVTKEVAMWVNIYDNCMEAYASEKLAQDYVINTPRLVSVAVPMTGTYKVEEK